MIDFPTAKELKKINGEEELLKKELQSILDLLLWQKYNLKTNFIFIMQISDKAKTILEEKGYKIEKIGNQFKITY